MTITAQPLPAVARPDSRFVLVWEWTVATPERQREAIDAAMTAWRHVPWPACLLAHHGLIGTDGSHVMHYTQWTNEEAASTFLLPSWPAWGRLVDSTAPGVSRGVAAGYQLYRSSDAAAPEHAPGASSPSCTRLTS